MPTANPREELDVVNAADDPIATATRREVHEEALLHRAVHALLVDGDGRLVLQRRSRDKRTYPGLLTSTASGHVSAGEDPATAVRRELEEEMGVEGTGLEKAATTRVEDLRVGEREIVHVFVGEIEAQPDPAPDEVIDVVRATVDEVRGWIVDDPGRLADSFVPVFEAVEDRVRELAEAR